MAPIFLRPWKIWWICWISRRTRHLQVPMISSTLQRSMWMTCGLFDSGFAGDDTSTELNTPADALGDFRLNNSHVSSFYPSVSGIKIEEKMKNNSWIDDFDDLSGDPLGDDSMEAFINLDTFLTGNSFFDEEGNLIVPNNEEKEEGVSVNPVIDFTPKAEIVSEPATVIPSFLMMLDQEEELSQPVKKTKATGKSLRKRSARKMEDGVKTSLYEIPAAPLISSIVDEGVDYLVTDTELDHDYSSKRQRMSDPVENTSTFSDTIEIFTQDKEVSLLPSTSTAPGDVLLNDSMDKQTIRRIKNNHASKRSRETRKQKFLEMDVEGDELIVKNQALREKIVELEKLAKEMKAVLVAKMAGKAL